MLRDQIAGKNNSWAIRWQASALLQDKFTLYPGRSLVQNIGLDSSGEHCGETTIFEVEIAKSPIHIRPVPIEENQFVLNELESYFRSIKSNLFSSLMKRARKVIGAHIPY